MASVTEMIASARRPADAVLEHVGPGSQIVVNGYNGEPQTVIDALEAAGDRLTDVRLHEMLAPRTRPSIEGKIPGLRHVSWFLSPHDKDAFHGCRCDTAPSSWWPRPKPATP